MSQRTLAVASGVSLRWLATPGAGAESPVWRRAPQAQGTGFLPDGSALARAVLDLRLRRAAGKSLVL